MLRVCGYARVSTKRLAQGESLENQIEYYTQEINNNPDWSFVGIYIDKDSGESVRKRKDFQRMIADCERGKIDLIVTKNCKRFARNVVECLEIIRRLRKKNIGVYFEQERINTLESNEEFFIAMAEAVGEYELKSHSQNVKLGIRYLFERGQSLQSFRMLGYEREGVRGLKVVPKEAELVRRIFDLYVSGVGSKTIAAMLNSEGYKTVENLPYKHFTILYILENERYAGNIILQKVYKKNYTDYKNNNGEYDKYIIYGTHEAIVEQETWNKAQEIRAKRNERNKNKITYSNPFKKYVVCGNCGMAYQLYMNNHGDDSKVFALKCYGRVYSGTSFCHNKPIRLETMKKLFIRMHNELIKSKDIIIRKRVTDAGIIELQEEIDRLTKRGELFMEMEVKRLLSDEAKNEYEQLITRLSGLQDEKAERLLRETNDVLQHQQSKELEKYIQTAKPLVDFDEGLFKKIINQIIVVNQEKVRFVLANDQEIEICYKAGKFKESDII